MPARKPRSAPAVEAVPEAPSRRRSLRVSSGGQKSKYFEPDSESEEEDSRKKGRVKGRPPKKRAKVEPETEDDDDNETDYKEQPEASQDAQDSDEELDEDAPPKVTFIPLPKLRDTGGIEYADDRLHPNTLAFLADLKANNKRSWLKCTHPSKPSQETPAKN